MGDFSAIERGKLNRLFTMTGEEYPLGKAGVDGLVSTTVTPAIRELTRRLDSLEQRIEQVANRGLDVPGITEIVETVGDLRYLRFIPGEKRFWMRSITVSAHGPLGTAGIGHQAMVADEQEMIFFWEPTNEKWWSVESWAEQWCGNTAGYAGPMRFGQSVSGGASGFRGAFNHLGVALVGMDGACNNATGPECCKIELFMQGSNIADWAWPLNTTKFSQSFNGINLYGQGDSALGRYLNIAATTTCGSGIIFPDFPKVNLHLRHTLNDGVVPPE